MVVPIQVSKRWQIFYFHYQKERGGRVLKEGVEKYFHKGAKTNRSQNYTCPHIRQLLSS